MQLQKGRRSSAPSARAYAERYAADFLAFVRHSTCGPGRWSVAQLLAVSSRTLPARSASRCHRIAACSRRSSASRVSQSSRMCADAAPTRQDDRLHDPAAGVGHGRRHTLHSWCPLAARASCRLSTIAGSSGASCSRASTHSAASVELNRHRRSQAQLARRGCCVHGRIAHHSNRGGTTGNTRGVSACRPARTRRGSQRKGWCHYGGQNLPGASGRVAYTTKSSCVGTSQHYAFPIRTTLAARLQCEASIVKHIPTRPRSRPAR